MLPLKSVAIKYDAVEDRILLAVNAGTAEACAFWLTRRLVLNIIRRAGPFVDRSSAAAKRTPSEYREEVLSMERDAAIAATPKKASKTPQGALQDIQADLAANFALDRRRRGYCLTLEGREGMKASGPCSRQDVQRLFHMMEQAIARAKWTHVRTTAGQQLPARRAH